MSNNPFNNAQTFMGIESIEADQLFGDVQEETIKVDLPEEQGSDGQNDKKDTVPEGKEINAEDQFGNDEQDPESVGESDDNKEREEAGTKKAGSSPKGRNLYSSFAQALKGDGLFQFLDEETVNSVTDADSFSEAIDKEVNSRLDDATRQVREALTAGVQPNVIAQYQRTIQNLNSITDEQLSAEDEQGANLRRSIIRQDLIIRGYKPDKVDKQVERIMSSGTDIDEASDALESVKEYFIGQYNDTVNQAKESAAEEKRRLKKEAEDFRKAVLETDKLFDEIPVDKATRNKAFEAMTRIVQTNEDGEKVTAVQKYADEHPVEFRTILGVVYAMTDGFTKMGNLFTRTVNKKVNSNLKEIERRLSNQSYQGGSFDLFEGNKGGRSSDNFRGLRIDIP